MADQPIPTFEEFTQGSPPTEPTSAPSPPPFEPSPTAIPTFDEFVTSITPPKRGALGEIGAGLERGMLGVGVMAAEAGRFISPYLAKEAEVLKKVPFAPVQFAGEAAEAIANIPWDVLEAHTKLTRDLPDWQASPEGHSKFVNWLAEEGEIAGPTLATLVGYAVPGIGPVLGPVATVALFGGSQAQETKEKLEALRTEGKTDLSDESIRNASLLTGLSQGPTELLQNYLGLKALGWLGRGVSRAAAGTGISGIIQEVTSPLILKPWAKATGLAILGEAGTEIAQDVATEAIERGYGAPPMDTYGNIAVRGGTAIAGLTLLLSPLGLAGHYKISQRAKAIDTILADPSSASPEARAAVVSMLHRDAKDLGVPEADRWRVDAFDDIRAGRSIRRVVADTPVADAAIAKETDPITEVLKAPDIDSAIKAADTAISTAATGAQEAALVTTSALDRTIAGEAYKEEDLSADQRALHAAVQGEVDYLPPSEETGYVPLLNGAPLRVINPSALPEADISGGKELLAEGRRPFYVTKSDYEALTVALGVEGKRLVVYEGHPDLPDGFARADRVPGVVFIANNPTVTPAAVAFHEADHLMRGTALHDAYLKTVVANLTPEAIELARERHGADLTEERLYEEIGADIHGDAMTRKDFWGKVIHAASQQVGFAQAHGEAQGFIQTLRDLISRTIEAVRGHTFITPSGLPLAERYVKNLSAVHDALATAIADVAVQRGYAPVTPTLEQAKLQGFMPKEAEFTPTPPAEEVGAAFSELASVADVSAHDAMVNVQQKMGGGVLNHLVEDVGTLLRHLTEKAYAGFAGQSEVLNQTARAVRMFGRTKESLQKEINENIKNNAKLMEVDPKVYRKQVYTALATYGREHAKFPVYNESQYLAREAAVAIGERRWGDARIALQQLRTIAKLEPKEYHARALEVQTQEGEIVSYETQQAALRASARYEQMGEFYRSLEERRAEKEQTKEAEKKERLIKAEPVIIVDPNALKKSQRHVNQLLAKIRAYPILTGGGTNLKMADEFHQTMVENLLFLHDLVPADLRERAKKWYEGVNRMATDMAAKYDLKPNQVAATIATLSPRKNWFTNLSLAERTVHIIQTKGHEVWTPAMTAWTQGYVDAANGLDNTRNLLLKEARRLEGRPLSEMTSGEAAQFVRVFDETYYERAHRIPTPEGGFLDYARVTVSDQQDLFQPVIGDRISTAWADWNRINLAVEVIFDGSNESIEQALGKGQKVRNFYQNIINPHAATGEVTIDTHALAAAQLRSLAGFDPEVRDLFNRAGLYDIVADAYRSAAEKRGLLPREIQSVTWEAVRALFPSSEKDILRPKIDAIWMEFRQKKITQQQARERIVMLSGGMRKFMWQDGGAGLFISQGGTSFEQNLHPDPTQRIAASRKISTLALRPEEMAPDRFMTVSERGLPYEEQAYPVAARVLVKLPGQEAFADAVKGLNLGHALRRAADNWPDAERIQLLGREKEGFGAIEHLQFSPRQTLDVEDRAIAREYDKAPMLDPDAIPAWDALKAETERLYNQIAAIVTIERVTGQPYADAAAMNADIAAGRFQVTTDNSEHPLWNVEDNFKFRVVHDYIGHYETGEDFTIGGERAAYEHHVKQITNDLAKRALKVEVYGQAAAAVAHNGEFQVQKVFLPGKEYEPSAPQRRLREPIGIRYAKKMPLLNIGMKTRDGTMLTDAQIRKAIEQLTYAMPVDITVRPGGFGAKGQAVTEPTAVVTLNKQLKKDEVDRLAVELRQEAIAIYQGGKGQLYGPLAKNWRQFNPDFFLTPEGRKLSEPERAPARLIMLTHYSQQDGLTTIDPSRYGIGQPGEELKRKVAAEPKMWVDRSYYYREGSEPEPRFKYLNAYNVTIDESKLFDLASYEGTVTEGEKYAKDQGFIGAYNSDGANPNAVELFYSATVETPKKERVTKEEGERAWQREITRRMVAETAEPLKKSAPFSAATARLNPGWPSAAKWSVTPPGQMDTIIRVLQDKHIDIARAVEAVKNAGGAVPDDVNPVLKEEMYHKRTEVAIDDAKIDELMPLLEAMRLHKVTLEQLDDALVARHVVQDKVNERLRDLNPDMPNNEALSGMTDADAQKILSGLDMKKYGPLFDRVDRIVNKTRQLMIDYGLETSATIERMKKTYNAYVPLRREGHEEEGYPSGTGRSVRGTLIKERLGSEQEVSSALSNIMQAREQVIVRGEKNKVSTAMAGLLMLHPNEEVGVLAKPAPIAVLNPATGFPEIIPGDITTKAGVSYKVPRIRAVDPATGTVRFYPDPRYKGRDNVVNFRVQGTDYAIVFNDTNDRAMEIAKAFKDLDTPPLSGLMGAIAPYTRYLASINTQYNPIFGIINFVRDAQFAMLTLTNTPLAGKQAEVLREAIASLGGIYLDARATRRGIRPTSPTAKLYERFEHVGGPTGYRDIFRTTADRSKEIERMLNPKDWSGIRTPADFASKMEHTALFEWLSDYNLMMENAVRLGVFKVATDMGISDIQAASYAKNITVNFNKKGQIGAQMGSLYAFFNANVQGTARLLATLFEPEKIGVLSAAGKKIITGGVLVGVLQTFALALSGYEPEDIPEFVKQRALVFPVPGTDKGYITIPMPLGFNIFPNIGRLAAETLYDFISKGSAHPLDNAWKLLGAVLNAFMPTGGSASLIQELSPTVTDPFLALEENMDWTGKPIYREDVNKLAPTPGFSRMRDGATIWSVAISRAMNWLTGGTEYTPGVISPAPEAIDYLISSATGGVGREVSKAVTTAQSFYTGEQLPVYKIPLAGRFIGSASSKEAAREKFYQNVKNINLAMEELKGRIKAGGEGSEAWRLRHPEAGLASMATSVERAISELRKEKRRLVSTGASREMVRLREDQISGLMQRLNEQYEAIVHPRR